METNNHIIDQLPDYVLGCLDQAEAVQVTGHVADCPTCQIELTAYQAVSDQLVLALPEREPPANLEDRLIAGLSAPSPSASSRPKLLWSSLIRRLSGLGPGWGMAGIALILILSATVVGLWQRVAQLEQQMQAGQHYAIDLIGTEAAQQATGFIIADARNQQNLLVVHDLPSLPEAQQYQLWLIKDGHRTSGAVFSVSPAGYGWTEITAPLPLSDYASFGVTIEPAGGSPGPTGAKVLGTTF